MTFGEIGPKHTQALRILGTRKHHTENAAERANKLLIKISNILNTCLRFSYALINFLPKPGKTTFNDGK